MPLIYFAIILNNFYQKKKIIFKKGETPIPGLVAKMVAIELFKDENENSHRDNYIYAVTFNFIFFCKII